MKNKYKILVLSDMNDKTSGIIKNGVSLAKMIDADVHFFHVKKPTQVVEKESQLSAIRTINKSFVTLSNEIKKMVNTISKDYDITMTYSHAFGNLKSEIRDCINTYKPDVIVIGKRKSKPLSFLGDNISEYIIKNFNGAIMIASDERTIEPNSELSLGVLNDVNTTKNIKFADSLLKHAHKPLKSFKTYTVNNDTETTTASSDDSVLNLCFDYGDNSIKSLSNYLNKSDVNLLCLDREYKQNAKSNSDIKNVINNVNVSLLISEERLGA